ncbi:hypothetical protein KC19_11G161800 [Ceratodon purpureus]|uniref:Uncharacterized protein n=1 Tax=Ceratodon purpureus TaxID=3225 RepID=A0A8T0GLD7_CERPU|nr:hypothetical protein KC19_11G161800 [Ceratodon purpureus]
MFYIDLQGCGAVVCRRDWEGSSSHEKRWYRQHAKLCCEASVAHNIVKLEQVCSYCHELNNLFSAGMHQRHIRQSRYHWRATILRSRSR